MKNFFGKIFALFAAIIIFAATQADAAELTILHTNDIHGRILPTDDEGKSIGLAELTAAVRKIKSDNPDTLWLDAGDTLHGMPYINISKGRNMLTLLETAGLDAMTPGNHEFNYGLHVIEELEKISAFPILSANVELADKKNKLLFQPYKIFKTKSGLKVGVFGLTTPETKYKARPSYVERLTFLNPVEQAKLTVKKLRSKCNVVIAVTHLGMNETSEFTSIKIAREVPGIDLIVDGHSHTVLPEGMKVGETLIVQTGSHAYNLGCATIKLDGKKITGKSAALLDKDAVKKISPEPDPQVAEKIREIERNNDELFDKVIAQNTKNLSNDSATVRTRETELGDLITDAFRWRTEANIAVINGGGIRGGLPSGNVTERNVMETFPFGNAMDVVEIQGKTVREMLEHSVAAYPETFGGFLQISGLRYTFDPTKPAGNRVGAIYVNNMPLDEEKIYSMALPDFLLDGGDDYQMLKELLIIGQFGTCDEILSDYLNEVGSQKIDTGRIIRTDETQAVEVANKKAA